MKYCFFLIVLGMLGCHSVASREVPKNVSGSIDRLLAKSDCFDISSDLQVLMAYEKPEEGVGKTMTDGSYSKLYHFTKLGITWLTEKDSQGHVKSKFYRSE